MSHNKKDKSGGHTHTGKCSHAAPMESDGHDSDHEGKESKNLQDPLLMVDLSAHQKSAIDLMEHLAPPVKRRVNALKKQLLRAMGIEAEFYTKVHQLECEYAEKTKSINNERTAVINGTHEPTDEEANFPVLDAAELSAALKEKANLNGPTEGEEKKAEEDIKGIPEFWLTVFKNVDILAEMIQEADEPIIRHLTDIEVVMSKEPMGFSLVFHFSPNEFFSNAALTKEYTLHCEPDKEEPFDFEGPEIIACKGCKIDWKTGKNVTVKLIKKKQKHKTKGQTRFVTKEVKADSFFNFFDPPEVPPANDDVDDETRELLNADFEIGQILRDRIVPRAVLYFTGEANDDESYDGDEDEDEELDEDEEEDDEGEDPQDSTELTGADGKEKPQECKQQ